MIEHLKSRHLDKSLYHVFIDDEEEVITFLLFNLSGMICGYQQYRPFAGKEKKNHPKEGRYFTYKERGKFAVFGLETWNWSNELYITEGIFDCVRLHNHGLAAIALLSNDPKELKNWFSLINRPIFAVCDEGISGNKLAKFAHKSYHCSGKKDLGDMSEKEVVEVIDSFNH